jgi:hypothetical protein
VNLSEGYQFLNFWINKEMSAFYTMQELDLIVDRGQMTLYSNYQPRYATSERIKDSLAPFVAHYDFTPSDTVSGYISVPSNLNFLNLLDVMITFTISGRGTRYVPVQMINQDDRANRLNSQIDPVTVTSPIGEVTAPGFIRLWPPDANTGTVTFLRRPVAPHFGYTTISGRVIVYDPATSVQLEWNEADQNMVYILALQSIGINISEQDVMAWSEKKGGENFSGSPRE